MKTITKQIKILALLFAIVFSTQSKAQCAASFTHSLGINGLVNFYSTSTPTFVPMSFNWNLGNNAVVGNTANPSTTYTANGTYTVFLTISTFTPFCTSTASAVITITNVVANPCLLNANFSSTQGANGLVNFNNTSTGTVAGTTYTWNFGDNTTSNSASPAHTYTANGSYFVHLYANNNFTNTCTDSAGFVINVTTLPCNLVAGFSLTQGANGLVNFASTSTGTINSSMYLWNFGDNTNGSGPAPSHVYANGTYTVLLTVWNSTNAIPTCSNSVTHTLTVVNGNPCNLNANFSWLQGASGLVNFNNTSTGTVVGTTYSWFFGDNTSSNVVSPAHTYTANGTYLVKLFANNNFTTACIDSAQFFINVNSLPCNLAANFTFTQGANGLVNFQSTSTGTTNNMTGYSWNFGNGSGSGIAPNRVYANGTYTVTLTVINFSVVPTCSSSISKTLTVNSNNNCTLTANFVATNGPSGLVNFSNTTSGAFGVTNYTWTFGTGWSSNLTNPSHTYLSAGVYSVTLLAKDSTNCTSSITKTVNISNIPCVANANFTLVPTNIPKFWNAIPSFPWNVTSASWSWGDGFTSNTLYASHLYSVSGTYTICLTVTVSCGATASFCSSYFVNKSSQGSGMDMININVIAPEIISQETGLLNLSSDNSTYNIYPNPSNGEVNVKIDGLGTGVASVTVLNLLGEKVYQTSAETSNGSIDKKLELNSVTEGIYFIKVDSQNKSYIKKIVVNK